MPNLRKPDVEKLNLANTTLLIKGFMGEGGRRRVEQDGAAGPRDVISHLGQQVAQLSLSLKAPQPSGVGTGHIHY